MWRERVGMQLGKGNKRGLIFILKNEKMMARFPLLK